MSKETLLQLVERLREAGQIGGGKPMLNLTAIDKPGGHNAAVGEAAKALVAEIESDQKLSDEIAAALEDINEIILAQFKGRHLALRSTEHTIFAVRQLLARRKP